MVVAIVGACLLGGCAGAPSPKPKPIYDHSGNARSLTISPPIVRKQRMAYARRGVWPWYHDRLNRRPGVSFGVESPTVQRAVTSTYDNLHTSPTGNVHDHYSRTTHRYRATQTVE